MKHPLNDEALDQPFREARTYNAWLDRPVSDEVLRRLYVLMKWGPTSANMSPARILFLRTREAKERLRPALMAGNVDKTMAAPVTAIIAHDELFYEKLPKLFPQNPGIRDYFVNSPDLGVIHGFRNGSLQGGYFILAARSLGLDCGPMSGFDEAAVDKLYFAGTRVRTNFLCNIGYGDPSGLFPRSPRLGFQDACRVV